MHNNNKIKEKRNWRSSPYFAPFGGGARFCPGADLARLQIALFLHYFLTTFRYFDQLLYSNWQNQNFISLIFNVHLQFFLQETKTETETTGGGRWRMTRCLFFHQLDWWTDFRYSWIEYVMISLFPHLSIE